MIREILLRHRGDWWQVAVAAVAGVAFGLTVMGVK